MHFHARAPPSSKLHFWPPFCSGRVDHLYTFFVQWSPETYRKHMKPLYNHRDKQQKRHSLGEKTAAAASKHLTNRGPAAAKNWDVRNLAPTCVF